MSWEYRVVHRCETLPGTVGVEDLYAIHEVYYDEHGHPKMVSRRASPLQAETLKALNETRMLISVACRRPVLEWHDFVPLPDADPARGADGGLPHRGVLPDAVNKAPRRWWCKYCDTAIRATTREQFVTDHLHPCKASLEKGGTT